MDWIRVVVACVVVTLVGCDEPEPKPCDPTWNDTCRAAWTSARATCEALHMCAALGCPPGKDECTLREALDACIKPRVIALCEAAPSVYRGCPDREYARWDQLRACIDSLTCTYDPERPLETEECPL